MVQRQLTVFASDSSNAAEAFSFSSLSSEGRVCASGFFFLGKWKRTADCKVRLVFKCLPVSPCWHLVGNVLLIKLLLLLLPLVEPSYVSLFGVGSPNEVRIVRCNTAICGSQHFYSSLVCFFFIIGHYLDWVFTQLINQCLLLCRDARQVQGSNVLTVAYVFYEIISCGDPVIIACRRWLSPYWLRILYLL